ncbi:MAG: cytochrome c-type biogenesis protein CcmH [Calditrichaeota bacterium]|nr:MAG: cytochrome c-type biogenesis protein CcmH [Calditrichota bacterium]
MKRFYTFFLVLIFSANAFGSYDELTAKRLEDGLIAPCCWTKSVSNETSGIAGEMKQEIRKLLEEGKSEQEIKDYYVSQYGKRVLAAPEMEGFGIAAYLGPWVFILIGLGLIYLVFESYRQKAKDQQHNLATDSENVTDEMQGKIDSELKKLL